MNLWPFNGHKLLTVLLTINRIFSSRRIYGWWIYGLSRLSKILKPCCANFRYRLSSSFLVFSSHLLPRQVYIIGHVPPGFFEKKRGKPWFREHFNQRYTEIIRKHHGVIAAQFMGHHHTDSFRMFYNDEGMFLWVPMCSNFPPTAQSYMLGLGKSTSISWPIQMEHQTGVALSLVSHPNHTLDIIESVTTVFFSSLNGIYFLSIHYSDQTESHIGSVVYYGRCRKQVDVKCTTGSPGFPQGSWGQRPWLWVAHLGINYPSFSTA